MKVLKKIGRVIVNLFMVILLVLAVGLTAMSSTLNTMFSAFISPYSVSADEEKLNSYMEEGTEIAQQIEGEGLVLVQNENDTLPLSSDVTKVNVFGWAATDWLASGSGSAQIYGGASTDFLAALSAQGVEYNTDLTDMYESFLDTRPYQNALSTYSEQNSRLYEPSVNDTDYYTEEMLAAAQEYSDTAIVVLGRYTGESNDTPKVQYKASTKAGETVEDSDIVTDETRKYLEISTEEEELLTYVGANYENVVVVINNTNAMELGFMETIEGLDSCMVVGGTGSDGAVAVAQAMYGEITPSGKLTDTYAYDMATAAAYANAGAEGEGYYIDADGMYPADGETTNGNVGDAPLYDGVAFVDYQEGIYVGYRWYETADEEGFWNDVNNEYGTGYEGVVQYPFGYGLSYTDFAWEVTDASDTAAALTEDGTIEVTVKVTNTGDVSGKDVVELYYSAPYTTGGIEKSSVVLGAFAKTSELAPGESEEITLSFDVEDMASYDAYDMNGNDFTGYELEAGTYTVSLRTDAHTVKEGVDVLSYNVAEDVRYETDSVTGAEVTNKFTGEDAGDGISIDGSDSDSNIVYLTRADFAGTFAAERDADRVMTDNLKETNLYTEEMAEEWIDESDEDITTGADNGLTLYDDNGFTELAYELGADFDDEQWDALLDQMTVEEMENLVLHGYSKTEAVDSIGKIQTKDQDGPAQVGGFTGMAGTGTGMPMETVLGQTWNTELAYQVGYIEGAQAGELGIQGWYAPSANIHRTALGGRNYEYYSEDALLSGWMAAKTAEGANDTGMFCYMKHLIGYEQDTNRDGIYTWMTEQALREIYLVPFKIAIQEGGLTGIMTSYNRLGAIWAGGSETLINGVVRDEFGFNGMIITDYSDHHIFMNGDQMLRAGGDIWMDGIMVETVQNCETESNSYKQALRTASKHIIYTWLNAAYENKSYVDETGDDVLRPVVTKGMTLITKVIIVVDIVAAVLGFFWIRGIIKRRRAKKAAKVTVEK